MAQVTECDNCGKTVGRNHLRVEVQVGSKKGLTAERVGEYCSEGCAVLGVKTQIKKFGDWNDGDANDRSKHITDHWKLERRITK